MVLFDASNSMGNRAFDGDGDDSDDDDDDSGAFDDDESGDDDEEEVDDAKMLAFEELMVALMDDQVAGLRANGVDAVCIHSNRSREDNVADWRQVQDGSIKLLYLSPERLMTKRMLVALQALDPAMFVVDEAHCISKWGFSFRPEYEALSGLRGHFPNATLSAFTATADTATR